MERLYCLLVNACLLLSRLYVIPCQFIIILDAVAIMLHVCIYTIISQTNVIITCGLNIMVDAVDIILFIHTFIS